MVTWGCGHAGGALWGPERHTCGPVVAHGPDDVIITVFLRPTAPTQHPWLARTSVVHLPLKGGTCTSSVALLSSLAARKRDPKPVDPLTKQFGSVSKLKKSIRRVQFVVDVIELAERESITTAEATERLGLERAVPKRDRESWMARYEEKRDVRALMHNKPGQGRKSAWTPAQRSKLKSYLEKKPTAHDKGRKEWPSCRRAAYVKQAELGLPKQSDRQMCNVARSMGLGYTPRKSKVLLTRAMRKRRIAFGTQFKSWPLSKWKKTLFIDEGGMDSMLVGPRCTWQRQDGTAPCFIKKVKGGNNKRSNFAVAVGWNVKLTLYHYQGGLNSERFIDLCEKQLVPFFTANPTYKFICMDGDKCHPGMGPVSSIAVNKYWREHPVLKNITLLSGPDEWAGQTGALRTVAEQQHALKLGRNKVPDAPELVTWPANSPDINIAEHSVASVKLPEDWAPGQYSIAEMVATYNEQYDNIAQSSINKAVKSMPARMAGLVKNRGWLLAHCVDY